jgi:hypothetical protein
MHINAEKTKVMSVGKGELWLPTNITISGGPVECVDNFKYLGGFLPPTAAWRQRLMHVGGRGICAVFPIFLQQAPWGRGKDEGVQCLCLAAFFVR